MKQFTPRINFIDILRKNEPDALAWVTGKKALAENRTAQSLPSANSFREEQTSSANKESLQLSGLVKFFSTPYGGVLIEAEIFGLPNAETPNSSDFYAMHIHQFGDCSDDFSKSGEHFNPTGEPHPYHAGDLLPLLGNQGYAWSVFYDKRFRLKDIIGRSVIIHAGKDDFTTQPSGNDGKKIGCGVIRPLPH